MSMAKTIFDFRVIGEGSVYLLLPMTDAANNWCDDHLPEDAPMMATSYAIEHRYIQDISAGILRDGMTITKDGMAMQVSKYTGELVLVA